MARFRRRLRRRRLRRPVRRRRLRRAFRRRRMRRSKGFTVGYHRDFELAHSSWIPKKQAASGSWIGVDDGNYATWSIPIVPPDLLYVPGSSVLGSWSNVNNLTTRSIGISTAVPTSGILTDLPTCVSSQSVLKSVNANALVKLMTKYRIAYCAATFTIPENTGGEKNHHLYLEWSHLPLATPCQPDSVYGMLTTGVNGTADDTEGWNWICKPIDVAEACSIPGKASFRHKWNRAQLTATAPVTIAWRPRHAAISADRDYYLDHNGNTTAPLHQDRFADKGRFVRSYLDIPHNERAGVNDDQVWLGPVVRLIDADIPHGSAQFDDMEHLTKYHIRVSFTIKLKLKGMKAADPLFPNFSPTLPN